MAQELIDAVDWHPDEDEVDREHYEARKRELAAGASVLKNVRKNLGFTQQEAARIVGTAQSFISKMENETEPRISVISKLIEAAGGRMIISAEFPNRPRMDLVSGSVSRIEPR